MGWEQIACWLCNSMAEGRLNAIDDPINYKCIECGRFDQITRGECNSEDLTTLNRRKPEVKAKLVGWILHQNRRNCIPVIDTYAIRERVDAGFPTTEQRAMFLLEEAIFGRSEVELEIVPTEQRFLNANYSINSQEVSSLLSYFEEENFVKSVTPKSATITVKGKIKAEKLLGIESA